MTMRTALKIFTIALLLINGAGALYGGWSLMRWPDGSGLHISTSWLRYSPFDNFFIPGLILFCVNGVLSFAVLFSLLLKPQRSNALIIAQGLLLTGWIVIQVILLREIVGLHVIMGTIGLLLMACGYVLKHTEAENPSQKNSLLRRSH
jgi:hypothetical protein